MHGDLYDYSLRWYLVCKFLHFIVSHGQIVNNFVMFPTLRGERLPFPMTLHCRVIGKWQTQA